MIIRQKQMSNVLSQKLEAKSLKRTNYDLFKYVDVKNNRYCLSISEKECSKMGITPLEYQKVIVDLGKTNRLVAESEKFEGQRIELGHSQDIFFLNGTSGHIAVSDMDAVKRKIFIPSGYNKVRFHSCVPRNSPYTIITCGVSVLGSGFALDSLNSSKFLVRSTEIALKSNNCNGELYFQIGDSTGGFGSWELIK